jgi:N-acylneuraminate cytidylyltransferase
MNRVACFVPIKHNSQRVVGKNLRTLGDKPLYRHTLDIIKGMDCFDGVYVDTDSYEIISYCANNNIKTIMRIPELLEDSATGNDLFNHWIKVKPNYDLYYQIHVICPFMTMESIKGCVNALVDNKEYDSVFSAVEEKSWYWFNDKPVNYDPSNFGRSQDARGVVRETTCLYGVRKNMFLNKKCRIGDKPFVYYVDSKEAIDIDNEIDFKFCETIIGEK